MNDSWTQFLTKRGEMVFSMAILAVLLILVLPLPPIIIDLLLSISIALSVLVILTVSHIKQPTEFFAFPTVLLFVTLFRLGLNVATTRAILVSGDAGNLINAFGEFVVQGNVVVGLIVFVILTIINFVVITKGAGRVAEVAARFTLDAMPGKQMSVDADLNAGIISEKEARERRKGLEREASFFGAMDGASKFVRGDAIAGILITGINLIGGFAVGILQMGLSASEAAEKFTLLSVGDGLVAQIPSLIVSTAAGILVTKSTSEGALGQDVAKQLFGSAKPLQVTGLLMWGLMLVPGFPVPVLFSLGAVLFVMSRIIESIEKKAAEAAANPIPDPKEKASGANAKDDLVPAVEPLCLELGLNLLALVQGNVKNLLDRLSALRKTLSKEYGLIIPAITVRDNSALPPHTYRILMRGHEMARSDLFPGQMLAMGVGNTQRPLRGKVTKEPAFGLDATWIAESERRDAERMGFAVVDPLSVLVTHFSELLKSNLSDLLSRQDVQKLLDVLKEGYPALVQEMGTAQVSLSVLHRVLQNLLRENVSIRELPLIVEKLCDQIAHTKNPDELSEHCRRTLTLEIGRQCEIKEGKLNAIALHPELEQAIVKGIRQTPQEIVLVMDPALSQYVHEELSKGIEALARMGLSPVLLCSAPIRLGMKRYFDDAFPLMKVLAYQELPSRMLIQSVYTVQPLRTKVAA